MADGISGLGATFSGEREFGDKLPGDLESFSYDDEIVRMFSTATLLWGASRIPCCLDRGRPFGHS